MPVPGALSSAFILPDDVICHHERVLGAADAGVLDLCKRRLSDFTPTSSVIERSALQRIARSDLCGKLDFLDTGHWSECWTEAETED